MVQQYRTTRKTQGRYEKTMKNILFYKYQTLKDLKDLKEHLLAEAKKRKLLGKVLIAKEGINGCVSGEDKQIEEYKKIITNIQGLEDIEFKEADTKHHNFKKIFVRIRQEIVTLKTNTKLENKADYIEPQELKELLAQEDVILIDARNNYESKIGRFKNAICPDIEIFSDWPKAVKQLEHLKDKKIVTYCTGGIRCEKASAYLKEQGFNDVKQLHGGIIRYGQEVGDFAWEGKCFVFDKRGAINIDPKKNSEDITQCRQCGIPTSNYHNCVNVDCDKRVILCEECIEVLEGCCDKRCRGKLRVFPQKRATPA